MRPLRPLGPRPNVTERLLAMRQGAGEDQDEHARYHRLVTRYQKWVLKAHLARGRETRPVGSERALRTRKFEPAAVRGEYLRYNIFLKLASGKNPGQPTESKPLIGKTR